MKNRKLVIIVLMLTISILTIYKIITPPITYKIDSRLVEINGALKELSEEHGFEFASVYSHRPYPVRFADLVPSEIYDDMRRLNIHVIHYYNGPGNQTAEFVIDRLLFSLSPSWYYLYSENGLVEEEVVPSIEEAVKQNDARFYAYCQKSEVSNWFFCTQDSGG